MVAGEGDLKAESASEAETGGEKVALSQVEAILPKSPETIASGESVPVHAEAEAFFGGVASLSLTAWMPSDREQTWHFPKVESLLIGSGPSAALRLEDASIQRIHCLLKVDERGLSVQQLGNAETSVRGEPLSMGAETRLFQGDCLFLGQVRLTVTRVAPVAEDANLRVDDKLDKDLPSTSIQARLYWSDICLASSTTQKKHLILEGDALKIPQALWRIPLAHLQKNQAVVFVPADAKVLEAFSSSPTPTMLEEKVLLTLGQSVAFDLKDGLRLVVSLGPSVSMPKYKSNQGMLEPFFWIFLVVFALMSAIVWKVSIYEVNEAAFVDEFFSNPQTLARWAAYVAPPKKKPFQEAIALRPEDGAQDDLSEDATQSDGPRGDSELKLGKKGKAGAPGTPSRRKVRSVGILGALSGMGGASGSVLSGGAPLSGGVAAALGKMNGPTGTSLSVLGQGADLGFGLRGLSGNGQGLGIGTLGAGGMGGLGDGGEGGQEGSGGGSGGRGSKKRRGAAHRAIPGKDVMVGSCEREVIGKAISKNARQILACYEAELLRSPHLKGKVTARFTIGANGRVGEVEIVESSLNDPGVEACLKRRIQRWRFPEPKGGGICVVNYPWMFQQAGGEL